MERKGDHRGRRLRQVIAASCAAMLALAAFLVPGAAAQVPLSIKVEGNHFVNGEGQTIRLLGVDHSSFEYACEQGYAYDDGHMDDADAAAVASWNADAVRVPLNEDCWLGINGEPSNSQSPEPPLTVTGYREAVENYVADLNAHGIYAILDLHWSAEGPYPASGQEPMPDAHSPAFWTSVATTFKSDPAVVFDLFNEPYSPADPRSGDDPAHPVSWSCWDKGGCTVPEYQNTGESTGRTYTAVGMQALVTAIRATGATQPVMVGGLNYANDLSGWLENAPEDPLHQEAASFHNYEGQSCDDVSCWNSQIAPVAAKVPVVTGEFDQDVCGPSNFDDEYMSWADAHGVSYLAWGWWVLSQAEIEHAGCSAYYLLADYDGTPASPNGISLHEHLLSLPPVGGTAGSGSPSGQSGGGSGGSPDGGQEARKGPITLVTFKPRVGPGGKTVIFRLGVAEPCSGVISGQTAKPFKLAGHRPRTVPLGTAHFDLAAGKTATVVLKLTGRSRRLLAAGPLRARFTLTLRITQNAATIVNRNVTLRAP